VIEVRDLDQKWYFGNQKKGETYRNIAQTTSNRNIENLSVKTNKRNFGLMKHLDYKGYAGTIEYSQEDQLLFGKIVGIRGLISYEGTTGGELEANFKAVIDDYLHDCKEEGIEAEKPFKGSFNVRIPSELHRDLAITAIELNTSQSQLIGESVRSYLSQVNPTLKRVPRNG